MLKAIFSLPFASTFPPMVKKQANLTSPAGLTFQETKILSFIVSGLSNKDIAFKLCISQSTVKTHVANIFKKLGLVNRTEASIYAVKNGLISGDNNVQK
ncbi:response regulator transcription factor [Desulfosporosinus sp. PR]|uniref:response regulator transcription factor n=1 Tax=Candidatus Desulfosporosinus nitrosoreducens TaxID=3401928 RepID=UPI0027F9F7C8|nr:response regulator transcription factor [Desulfosporosinus sp. PR]MDQ7092851.1 response regulator transcription factor [Desulfosporosinus sp. PR]